MSELENKIHERFAQEFVSNYSVRLTSIEMGIGLPAAYRIYGRDDVKQRIAEITGGVLADIGIRQDMIIEGLADIALNLSESTKNRLKALELIGKHLGMFVDKIEDVTNRGHDEWVKLILLQAQVDNDQLWFLK